MGQVNGNANDVTSFFTQEEINKLYQRFKKLDTDGNDELSPEEFLDIPALTNNPLVHRVIHVFDKNKDGKISFPEFLEGLSTLSVGADDEKKMHFVFQVYDYDDDGVISNGDLFKVLKMMVGNNLSDVQLQQLVDRTIIKADKDKDGVINFEEFCDEVRTLNIAKKLTLSYS